MLDTYGRSWVGFPQPPVLTESVCLSSLIGWQGWGQGIMAWDPVEGACLSSLSLSWKKYTLKFFLITRSPEDIALGINIDLDTIKDHTKPPVSKPKVSSLIALSTLNCFFTSCWTHFFPSMKQSFIRDVFNCQQVVKVKTLLTLLAPLLFVNSLQA